MSSSRDPEITAIAERLGVPPGALRPYGRDKAKIDLAALGERPPRGRLVLVTGMTPTPAGEGKTTTSIGLADGFSHLGHRACVVLREPSLGPCFGLKGVGTGFGRARLVPTADINLHFTGDFHAVTTAHNLLAALVDNHLHHGGAPALDPARVIWRRVLDLNDRVLRIVEVGRGKGNGSVREAGFDITAASEIMAILALAADRADLRARLGRIVVGFSPGGAPVTASDLRAVGAMMALLRDAVDPNLVRTVEGTPALVHAGPFANIAHGTSSMIAARTALGLTDWVVTEAGFGFDLGGEKFFDIVVPTSGLPPAAVVIVATVRALRMHGGRPLDEISGADLAAVQRGLPNLRRHVDSAARFGRPIVVALNAFPGDSPEEAAAIEAACRTWGTGFSRIEAATRGGEGGAELAKTVIAAVDAAGELPPPPTLYPRNAPLVAKVEAVARTLYGARGVVVSELAAAQIADLERLGFGNLPVCIAKTQASFTDDPTVLGAPTDFTLTIRRVELAAGAGFVVILAGSIMRMPGLPREPRALDVDLIDGEIHGIG